MLDESPPTHPVQPRINAMASEERPRERLAQAGANARSNAELLAILFSTGLEGEHGVRLSERILAQHGGRLGLLRISYSDLKAVKGLGQNRFVSLKERGWGFS